MARGGGAFPLLLAQAPPAPSPSPPPMPYMTPVPPAMRSQTEKGVRYTSNTILLFIVAGVLGIVLLVALLPILAELAAASQTGTVDPAILGALVGFIAAACGLLLVSLIGLILGFIGLLALHKGGSEFGPEHSKWVDRGIIVLIIGIIVPLVGSSIVSAASISGLPAVPGAFSVPTFTIWTAVGSIAFGVLEALLVGLFLLWSVQRLAAPSSMWKAQLALALGIGSGIASGIVSLVVLATTGLPAQPEDFGTLILAEGLLVQGLSIPSLALWYSVYSDVLGRFRRRELQPAPPAWMYYPPAYYPPAAYYPPPQAPPPSPPPPGEPPPQ